jgi:phospholipid transport system transporter-binding protein
MSTMTLPAVLTMAQARETLARLEPALRADGELTIDASQLTDLDSAAIAVLLHCRRIASAAGRSLRVTGAPAKLGALAALYGVKELLGLAGRA